MNLLSLTQRSKSISKSTITVLVIGIVVFLISGCQKNNEVIKYVPVETLPEILCAEKPERPKLYTINSPFISISDIDRNQFNLDALITYSSTLESIVSCYETSLTTKEKEGK